MSDEERPQKRTKGRSPAYPAISLERAIQRVRQLYARDRQFPIPVSSVPEIWGYTNLNGPSSLAISALKKFGLVSDEGTKEDRRITVTDSAVNILNHPSSDAREEAIRTAALLPPIHRELWDAYKTDLPSDANLEWRLTRERGFTETGAKEFIREWRETMEFAGLSGATELGSSEPLWESAAVGETEIGPTQPADQQVVTVSPPPVDSVQGHMGAGPASEVQHPPAMQNYPIPIALHDRPPVVISGAFPLTEAEWAQFKAVLDAMRPGLVSDGLPKRES